MARDGKAADPLVDVVDSVIRRSGESDWRVDPGPFWCRVEPAGVELRKQGWKLHVSTTVLAAPLVLYRAAEVLVAHRASFKFAGTLARVSELTSGQVSRGGGGKFITVYPYDDERFRRLGEELSDVLAGLPGPGVLSDRQFRPDSPVFYRYGGFTGTRLLTNDGTFDVRLEAPDGQLVKDLRRAWFSPPPWASSPLPEPEAKPAANGAAVLLNDRYVVRRAIRHAYKGGVYLGVDQRDGGEVVIKEARRHVKSLPDGTDVQDMLRNEAEVLAVLEPLGSCPRLVETFRQGTSVFIVQERIAGDTLRGWIAAFGAPPRAAVLDLADQMVTVVEGVHAAGFALRDFNPNNLMVTPERVVRLIDLEMAARPGTIVWRSFTPGYGAPEVVAAPSNRIAAEIAADRYSLGAVLFHLATGADPLLVADEPASRPMAGRLEPLIAGALGAGGMGEFTPLVLGLMADAPDERWSLDRVREYLASLRSATTPAPAYAGPPVDRARMLDDGLDHLLATMRPDADDRLWPAEGFSAINDPLNVQHGAGGVLAVLTTAAEQRGDERLRAGVATAARWITARLGEHPKVLPGLYFGRSGTAWALLEASRVLGGAADLEAAALDLARRVPVRWPNPDVCHGAAGAGLGQLHFWRATGDPDFRDRAVECADGIAAAAEERPFGVVWPIPATFDSELAGLTHFGFGHGVAGIGTFLLLTGAATGRDDLVDLARRAGDTLERIAVIDDGAAYWPTTAERPGRRQDMVHWCSGASGVGTFLVRLWRATGEDRYRELAEAGAAAVHRMRWLGSPVACHGLSGNAEFLLDLADALDEPRYRRWAEDLLACVHARHVVRDGRLLVADETMFAVSADYQTGLAGLLAFLLRLDHGARRLWLPEPVAATALTGVAA